MGTRLLISTWGKPDWSEVRYSFEGEKRVACTTLPLLQEKLEPEGTVIISSETLATGCTTYQEVLERAENMVREKADGWGIKNYEVWVAPAKGNFPQALFHGSLMDFYHLVLDKLAQKILGMFHDLEEVHLDITHGINFMTVLTYRAVRTLLGITALFKDVKFVVYNSDPFFKPRRQKEPDEGREENTDEKLPVLLINKVEEVTVAPQPYPFRPKGKPRLVKSREDPKLGRLIDKTFREVLGQFSSDALSAFIGAVHNGLPLVLVTFFPDTELLRKALDKARQLFHNGIDVETEEGRMVVRKAYEFTGNFEAFACAWLTGELLKKVGVCGKEEITIGDLEFINDKVFSHDERFWNRIRNEFYNIRRLEERLTGEWRLYNSILGEEHAGGGPERQVDKRNFLAHAGFERNAVELSRSEGCIKMRYAEAQLETVRRLSWTGLKEVASY